MAAVVKTYKYDDIIFNDGDSPFAIYIIRKGTVSIRKKKGSSFVEIGKLYQNEVLGEMAFFDRKPRSATAVATSDVELLEIQFDGLEKVYGTLPDYLKSIIAALVERLRKANETIRKIQDAQEVEKVKKPDPKSPDGKSVDSTTLEEAAAILDATAAKKN